MSKDNVISVTIAPADLQAMIDAVNLIKSKLPFLISLTPEERKEMPKMGDKTIAFVSKSVDYTQTNPETVPAYLNAAELAKDMVLVKDLFKVFQPLQQLCEGLDDTLMVAGSEAYQGALIYYNSIKGAQRADVVGSKTILNDLKERFPGRSKKSFSGSED